MKLKQISFFFFFFLFGSNISYAQFFDQPKVQIGVNGGIFRISIDRYNDFYGNRIGFPVGGSIGYAISHSFHIMFRGKYFQKNYSEFDQMLDRDLNRKWREVWYELGIQQYTISFSGNIRTYLGFGLAFFYINEKEDGDFLTNVGYSDRSINPRGFYLAVGFDRYLLKRLTLSFEIELTSAGVGKGTGLESQSIGGIFIGLGLNWQLF